MIGWVREERRGGESKVEGGLLGIMGARIERPSEMAGRVSKLLFPRDYDAFLQGFSSSSFSLPFRPFSSL
jgi:hypothetical protein